MNKLLFYSALLVLAQGAGCKLKDLAPQPPTNPVDQLPPATETGQRTFGCLLNGQAWNQAGNPFAGPVFAAEVSGKRLGVSCRRAYNDANGVPAVNQSMGFAIDSVSGPGVYQLTESRKNVFNFSDYLTSCQYSTGNGMSATVQLTRFDPVNRIVARRFSSTLETPGCGRMVITEGRFDSRF